MNLTQYVDHLHHHLTVAAEAGGSDANALAERLLAPLETATRLVLLEALSAAAGEISRDLAPGSVDLRLRGRDPEFVVVPPARTVFEGADHGAEGSAAPASTAAADGDDGNVSRITLRLPEQLKQRMEEAANREGLSVNAWLVRAVAAALEPKERRRSTRHQSGERYTGWVR
jgi:predicted HicB family RNase H-like nuclease